MLDLEYAVEVADEYGRRIEQDALRRFAAFPKPYPEQREFYEDDTTREVHLLGANRSGKTIAACARAARRVRYGGADRVWIVSRSNASTRQNILPYLYEGTGAGGPDAFIPASDIAQVRTVPDHEIVGKDGWRIVLKSNEMGRDKFAGAALDEIIFDEPPDWPVYNECIIRFGAGKRCLIRIAATLLPGPGEAGGVCQWLWSEKIEPWLNKRSPPDFKILNVAMRDNPYITPEQLEMAQRLYPPGSLDRMIRIEGQLLPGLVGNRAYAAFDRKLHVNKSIGPQSIDAMRPLYIGLDVNANPLCAVILQLHGKIWRALDEVVLRPGSLPEMGERLKERFGSHRHEIVLCGDAMGTHVHAQTGKTDYEVLLAAMSGLRVRLAVPQKNPPDRDRVNLVNFLLGSGGHAVRHEIAAGCTELIADLEQVLWAPDGSHILKSHKPESPYYQRTHTSDGDGYVLWAREAAAISQATRGQLQTRPIPSPSYGFTRPAA
jgi:phage terminase large subunit-like protein